jgi:hypothetical protein
MVRVWDRAEEIANMNKVEVAILTGLQSGYGAGVSVEFGDSEAD